MKKYEGKDSDMENFSYMKLPNKIQPLRTSGSFKWKDLRWAAPHAQLQQTNKAQWICREREYMAAKATQALKAALEDEPSGHCVIQL